jgi:hypothetical protein
MRRLHMGYSGGSSLYTFYVNNASIKACCHYGDSNVGM